MKNLIGILVILIAFGALFIACGADGPDSALEVDPALDGTWISDEYGVEQMTFNNGIFEWNSIEASDPPVPRPYHGGTYTTSNGQLTITVTHHHPGWLEKIIEVKWYTKDELRAALIAVKDDVVGIYFTTEEEFFEWLEYLDVMFPIETFSYSVIDNKLTLSGTDPDGKPFFQTYTRE